MSSYAVSIHRLAQADKLTIDTSAHVPPGVSQHEPLFLSLSDPSKLSNTAFITSRNNLRKVFMFLLPLVCPDVVTKVKSSSHSFQINAHVLPSGQILLDRIEPPTHATTFGGTPQHWHLAYHEVTTARVFKGSDRTPGCIRVVGYDWAGMGMVVRFDVDGFVPDEEDEVILEEEAQLEGAREGEKGEVGSVWSDLSLLVSDCTLDEDVEAAKGKVGRDQGEEGETKTKTSSGITVIRHPYPSPPHDTLISLKIRNLAHQDDPIEPLNLKTMNRAHDVYAQLVFARMETMFLAHHRNGDFFPVCGRFERVERNGRMWRGRRRRGLERLEGYWGGWRV